MVPEFAALFTALERDRAQGLAARIAEITSTPGHPSRGSLPHYEAALRDAKANAAAGHPTAEPADWGA